MTTGYQVGCSLVFVTENPAAVNFEDLLSRFYDELLDAEERETDIIDPDIAAHLGDLTAEVQMQVEAESPIDAQVRAICVVRSALHAIEVATPGWEAVIREFTKPAVAELQDA